MGVDKALAAAAIYVAENLNGHSLHPVQQQGVIIATGCGNCGMMVIVDPSRYGEELRGAALGVACPTRKN